MKLHELIKLVDFEKVKETLINSCKEEHTTGYEKVFSELITMEPKESEDNMRVIVKWHEPDPILDEGFEEEGYWHVGGKNGKRYIDEEPDFVNEGDELAYEEVPYALDFTAWDEWLGMEVDEISFEKLTYEEACAHILWEMTFHGFEESDVLDKRDELLERLGDIKNGKTSGEYLDIDEFKKRLDELEDEEDNYSIND